MTARANKRRKARARRRLKAWRSQGFRYLWRGARIVVHPWTESRPIHESWNGTHFEVGLEWIAP